MSYEIVYKKYNIKVGDKILPLLLIGSNNCFDGWRPRRRSRDWIVHSFGIDDEKLLYDVKELEEADKGMRTFFREKTMRGLLREGYMWDYKKKTYVPDPWTDKNPRETISLEEIDGADSQWWLSIRTMKRSSVKELVSFLNRTRRVIPFDRFIKRNGWFEIELYVRKDKSYETLYKERIQTEEDMLRAAEEYEKLGSPRVNFRCISSQISTRNLSDEERPYVITNGVSLFCRKYKKRTVWTTKGCADLALHFKKESDALRYIDKKLDYITAKGTKLSVIAVS